MASVVSTAFRLTSTDDVIRTVMFVNMVYIRVLPLLIATSKVATKSVNFASTSSNPARTLMMSELGLLYFLVKTAEKKDVRV